MKLFSFRKQKQQEGFAFLVKDMFDLRDGGVVVAGQVTEGIIHQGGVHNRNREFLCLRHRCNRTAGSRTPGADDPS